MIQIGINKQLQELDGENRALQQEVVDLKKEKQDLEKLIPRQSFIDPKDAATALLQEEIAGLREKIVQKEQHAKKQREEIDRVFRENEEFKQELKDVSMDSKELEAQLAEAKESTSKKMEQKDETIAFMQTEMMRIMKEKQALDKKVRGRKLDNTELQLIQIQSKMMDNEEAEMIKIQSINAQLRQFDEENRLLEEKLKDTEYQMELQLKEKDSRILEIEEAIADLRWELKVRKEADYATLLKDRKERKKELDVTKKSLKKSQERIGDLEREIKEMETHQQDLERDVEELKKSLFSRDSGDYVSGLTRQIKSLKEHNMALDRKADVEISDAADALRQKGQEIAQLEQEINDLKNPAQAAVRGIFSKLTKKNVDVEANRSKNKTTGSVPGDTDTSEKPSQLDNDDATVDTGDGTSRSNGRQRGQVTKSGESQAVSENKLGNSRSHQGLTETKKEEVKPAPNILGMKSLWSAVASPFGGGSKQRIGLSHAEKKALNEKPINEGFESDDELDVKETKYPSGEKSNLDSKDEEQTIEDELKAIEDDLHSVKKDDSTIETEESKTSDEKVAKEDGASEVDVGDSDDNTQEASSQKEEVPESADENKNRNDAKDTEEATASRLEPKEEENTVADATAEESPAADNDESTEKKGPVQEGDECSAEVDAEHQDETIEKAWRDGSEHEAKDNWSADQKDSEQQDVDDWSAEERDGERQVVDDWSTDGSIDVDRTSDAGNNESAEEETDGDDPSNDVQNEAANVVIV
jgi:hypothetical protein